MPKKIRLAEWDGDPAVLGNGEAYYFDFNDKKWHPADRGKMVTEAGIVSPEMFFEMFGELRPLPENTFKDFPSEGKVLPSLPPLPPKD